MTPRAAVIHPLLVAGGGSEACALGAVRALQDDYRVTLITMDGPDLAALDAKYGSGIDLDRLETRFLRLPPGTRRRFDAVRAFPLARHCRRHAADFDVMISAYNVMDFGAPGIQLIADFSFDDALRRELDFSGHVAEGAFQRPWVGRSLYLGLARALAGDRRDGWKRNRTVANSRWVAGLLRERFGVEAEVVYPPVVGDFPAVPWNEREDGFVVLGRLVPEKGIPLVLDILGDVRKSRPVHLHVIGRRAPTPESREIEDLCRRHGDWVTLEPEMYGPKKAAFLAAHKYGISGRRMEAFGIAVADMVRAGQIVWVPDGGGQTEIVADPSLVYRDRGDAAARILDVLDRPERQAELRGRLEVQAGLFSGAHFADGLRRVVRDFLKEGPRRGA